MLKVLLLSMCLFSTMTYANLNTELASQETRSTVPVSIVFDKRNINLHPECKQSFIEFASSHLTTQDEAMLASIKHLVKIYPEDCKEKFAHKEGVIIPPAVQQLLQEYEAGKNKTPLQKMASAVTVGNVVRYGLPIAFAVITKFPQLQLIENETGENISKLARKKNPSYEELERLDNSELVWNGFELIPVEQWPRVFLAAFITGNITGMIQQRAEEKWAYSFELPEYDKNSWNVERHASGFVSEFLWMGVSSPVNSFIINPLLSFVLP